MTDQHRADACRREGFDLDTTPFLDSLARQGTWFDRAYTTTPLCVPARTSFLTGRFPSWTEVQVNSDLPARFDRDLFAVLSEQGYTTSLCGKNHSYLEETRVDHWYEVSHLGGNPRSREGERWDEWIDDNVGFGYCLEPAPTSADATPVGRVIAEAIEWLSGIEQEPFFQWLSIPEPHPPYTAPEPYFSLFDQESLPAVTAGSEARARKDSRYELVRQFSQQFVAESGSYEDDLPAIRTIYYGMLRMIDDQIHRLVQFLDDAGLREETVIVFLSDHGDYVGEYGMMRKAAGVPESLVRIPLFFTGPGIEAAPDPHPAHVSIADLLPTLCEVANASIPGGVQGRSLWPVVTGQSYPESEFSSMVTEIGYGGRYSGDSSHIESPYQAQMQALSGLIRGIRKDQWKFTIDQQGTCRLYDLTDDPAEIENLYTDPDYADISRELLEELLTWQLRLDALDLPAVAELPDLTHDSSLNSDPHNYWESEPPPKRDE